MKLLSYTKLLLNLPRVIYKIKEDTEEIKKMSKEILSAQVLHDTIKNSVWFKIQSVSPGEWAMDYAAFYTVYRILNDTHPQKVLEFGLGQMSKMLHQYRCHYPDTFVVTIEHDKEWAALIEESVKEQAAGNYSIHTEFIDLKECFYKGYKTLTYIDINKYMLNIQGGG